MRRSALTGIALVLGACAYSVAGCEDGPNQTYTPASGTDWNNGGSDASTSDPGSQGFDAGGGGTNAVNICTAAEQQQQWTKAFTAPIIPPFSMGGIDYSAGGTFEPVTIEDVERGLNGQGKLCQGFNNSSYCTDGSGNPGYAWGESQQLQTCYDIATHQVTFFNLSPGYDGTATFTLPATYNGKPVPYAVAQDGSTGKDLTYVWQIGKPVTENGKILDMQWAGADNGLTHTKPGMSDKVANKMFLAITYTFNPTLIGVTDPTTGLNWMTDPNYNCVSTGLCRVGMNADGSLGSFGARSVALYAYWQQSNAADTASRSTPSQMYMWPVKYMPYSFSNYNMGLDTFIGKNTDPSLTFKGAPIYGPYTPAGILSPKGNTPFCTLYMGDTYADFKKNCLMVSGDAKIDATTLAKLLGGQHHTAEWFTFSVNGQNAFFSADAAELAPPNYVLADSVTEPPADSVATTLFNDIRSYGLPLNDVRGDSYPSSPAPAAACVFGKWAANGGKCPTGCSATDCLYAYEDGKLQGQDFHGSAAVLGYFRQLVFDDLRAQLTAEGITPMADPTKCWIGSANPNGYIFPDGCTGFEMMVTPGFPLGLPDTVWQDKMDLGPKGYHALTTLFRSGDPVIDFMADPSQGAPDDSYLTGGVNDVVQAALLETTYVIGHGDIAKVPAAARDWRYYFRFWADAFMKYMLNRSKNPNWHQLYTDTCGGVANGCRQVNQDALFFDLQNGLDKFEYIDRSQAATLGSPVDFEYNVLITSTNTQSMNFYQRLTRGENAMYTAMLEDKTKVPGSNENVNVSDLFGSIAISNAGVSAPSKTNPAKDAWYCATHGTPTTPDPECPNGPPTDSSGNMLVDGENRPLFTNYHGVFTGTAFTIGSVLPISQVMPDVAGAIVNVPNYANPYDTTSKNTPISVFIPHIPYQPGNGFEIPINAQRSQFVQTGALDFSGVTITDNIDYIPQYDPKTGALTGAKIAAVETQDFLGEVWPCVDPTTGDILRVKMYSSFLDIQNWLDSHPGSRSACNIFVRMSPYNNYPDYLWSTSNGILLGVNPAAGGGFSRVGDVTVFDPSLLTQTQ